MKLTGILKNKVDKAETMAEKKDIIAQAGVELNDNELEMVTGGLKVIDYEELLETEELKHIKDIRDKYFR